MLKALGTKLKGCTKIFNLPHCGRVERLFCQARGSTDFLKKIKIPVPIFIGIKRRKAQYIQNFTSILFSCEIVTNVDPFL